MNKFFRKENIVALVFGLAIGLVFAFIAKKIVLGLVIAVVFWLAYRQRRGLT